MSSKIIAATSLFVWGCATPVGPGSYSGWAIPEEQVFVGCEGGHDCIPALTNPRMVAPGGEQSAYLDDDERVVGVVTSAGPRAYPHPVLDWHEIINDEAGGDAIAVNYCPLTGSAYVWSQTLETQETTFGVSGFLYNSNLILYDRSTGSHWAQMSGQAVQGDLRGARARQVPWLETKWRTWKALHPDTKVVSSRTGHDRGGYRGYPYFDPVMGDYRNNDFIIFPVENWDTRLAAKKRVLGLEIGAAARAYPLPDLWGAPVNDELGGTPLVVFGDNNNDFAIAFDRRVEGRTLSFERVPEESPGYFPYALRDLETESLWTIEGEAREGSLSGVRLTRLDQVVAYWFAWAAFHPETEIRE